MALIFVIFIPQYLWSWCLTLIPRNELPSNYLVFFFVVDASGKMCLNNTQ